MRPIARSSQIDGNQGVIFMIISKHAGYEAALLLVTIFVIGRTKDVQNRTFYFTYLFQFLPFIGQAVNK